LLAIRQIDFNPVFFIAGLSSLLATASSRGCMALVFREPVLVFGSEKRRIRPSNWIQRLMDIARAHWAGTDLPLPCGICHRCGSSHCFVFPARLQATHPDLVRDLLFCLRMLEVPEIRFNCSGPEGPKDMDHRDAA
jgi:hypothetical protein